MWGSSPQVLRMQAQAQKKARMLLQQQILLQQQQQQQQLQELQNQQQIGDKVSKKGVMDYQDSNGDPQDDQFQIITLKDCQDNSEENFEKPADIEFATTQETEKPGSPSCSKVTNNVRLNGPQETFVDPLNATCMFPVTEPCKPPLTTDVATPSTEANSQPQESEKTEIPPQAALPIPDLLAEAVPKVVVDLVHTVKLASSNPVSLNRSFAFYCFFLIFF